MTDTFDYVYKNVIDYFDFLTNSGSYYKGYCDILKRSRVVLKVEYENIKKHTKENYMEDKKGLLDRHKCAASFMIAILQKMELADIERSNQVSKVIRGKIAMEVGIAILVTMTKHDAKPENKIIIDYWNNNNNKINFPNVLCDRVEYRRNWASELCYALRDNKLFVPAIANELFLLDVYNRQFAANILNGVALAI
ncbi:MAG: hypothetical protein LBB56_08645 [Chitinispirillales bacterium]|jgi:hypothetical protein|nr:hypothetical protein [Chitinispirillales bacterium]